MENQDFRTWVADAPPTLEETALCAFLSGFNGLRRNRIFSELFFRYRNLERYADRITGIGEKEISEAPMVDALSTR